MTRQVAGGPSMLLDLHAANPNRYPALLASAATSTALGQFDILFAFPGERVTLLPDERNSASFLSRLDGRWKMEQTGTPETRLPFHGGWLVYLSYELAVEVEPRLKLPPAKGPVALAMRIPAAVIYEHATQSCWLIAEPDQESKLQMIEEDISNLATLPESKRDLLTGDIDEDPPEQYLRAVERALAYIEAGDIYQANLSRGWRARLNAEVKPTDIYRRLRQSNPGPFSALAQFDDLAVISSSPERLVSVRHGYISTRPIAGTRPRGKDLTADRELISELSSNLKERAEHIMLLDLERNDLGRVCAAGSVEVDEFMTIESYAHVHHIVSNVRGRLRADVTPGQALAAVFPGGTITGCPKVRCMEIIAELEGVPRGAYTGSLGYLNRDGSMDFNILIRSLEVRGEHVSLRAGAGIVADSIPQRELDEARAKARGVLNALTGVRS
ncbi:MAG: aminodeoxychorismate synthase component I [Povalibacter sp.]